MNVSLIIKPFSFLPPPLSHAAAQTDLADAVGADLEVMKRDARRMSNEGVTIFAQVTKGVGVREIASHICAAMKETGVLDGTFGGEEG